MDGTPIILYTPLGATICQLFLIYAFVRTIGNIHSPDSHTSNSSNSGPSHTIPNYSMLSSWFS